MDGWMDIYIIELKLMIPIPIVTTIFNDFSDAVVYRKCKIILYLY